MDMDVIIGCCIFLAIVGYLVYAKPWKKDEFATSVEPAVEEVKVEETLTAKTEEIFTLTAKTEEIFAKIVEEATKLDKEVGEVLKEVVATVEPVKEEAPAVVVEPEDTPKPKRGRKGKK